METIHSCPDDELKDVFVALNPYRFGSLTEGDNIEIICTIKDGKLKVVYCDLCV